jgi:folylpolyglutamate synthase/dihydropteroate synthase
MEVFERDGKTVVVDAAHNAQKLEALGRSMHTRYSARQPVAAVVSLAAGREYRLEESAREMAGLAGHLIVTSFHGPQDGPHHSVEPRLLAAACKKQGAKSVEIIEDPAAALQALLARPEQVLLVTGSFYLLNHIRPLLLDR